MGNQTPQKSVYFAQAHLFFWVVHINMYYETQHRLVYHLETRKQGTLAFLLPGLNSLLVQELLRFSSDGNGLNAGAHFTMLYLVWLFVTKISSSLGKCNTPGLLFSWHWSGFMQHLKAVCVHARWNIFLLRRAAAHCAHDYRRPHKHIASYRCTSQPQFCSSDASHGDLPSAWVYTLHLPSIYIRLIHLHVTVSPCPQPKCNNIQINIIFKIKQMMQAATWQNTL